MEEKRSTLYVPQGISGVNVGIDESNHGRYPEVFTGVASCFERDINEGVFPKKRGNHKTLFGHLNKRDYSFLFLEENDLKRIGPENLLGTICASLIMGFDFEQFEKIRFWLDGEITFGKKAEVRKVISYYSKRPVKQIKIEGGPRFDQTYGIVNLADELAHYIFRKTTIEENSRNPHRKTLIA